MNRNTKILLIEDEKDITRILKDFLTSHGYEVLAAATEKEGMALLNKEQPDFLILDIMLPDADGIELCRKIREQSSIPILILSARDNDTDKVLGLGFGADDYMTKPFSLSELEARIKAHLRRIDDSNSKGKQDKVIRFHNFILDKNSYRAVKDDKTITLTAKEFDLLYFLAENKNIVFSKSQLLDAVWGYEVYGDENTITVYIRRLREKIEDNPAKPVYIKTVWGVGYKFALES